jgi:HlyD family secretion protein
MKRFLPFLAIVVGLSILLLIIRQCRRGGDVAYQTAPVTRGPLTQLVTATGTLNPVVNVQVGSQVSGNIQKLFADFNSKVKAGDVVAQIDPVLFQATVTQAEGDLANAQAALELAKVTASRTQELVAKQNSAKADLEHCTIKSPVDGEVISRSVDVGQTVAASLQAPVIFAIANDLTKMQIDSNVAEADVGAVTVDQTVDFTVDAFPFRTFHGKVVQVRNAPITVQNVVTYDTVIGVSNDDLKLKPGMTANVSIIIEHRDDARQIKNAAFRYRPADSSPPPNPPSSGKPGPRSAGRDRPRNERTIYVLSGGKPKPVQIKIGISDGIVTEVTEGLKEGDSVVTAAVSTASPGQSPAANPFAGGRRPF